jgi:hypothetical protein
MFCESFCYNVINSTVGIYTFVVKLKLKEQASSPYYVDLYHGFNNLFHYLKVLKEIPIYYFRKRLKQDPDVSAKAISKVH